MKIISFNIGIKIDNAEGVSEYLKSSNADIICIQEAMRPFDSNVVPMYRSAETIEEALKEEYPYYFFAPEWVADILTKANGTERDFGGMVEQGKLVLSKYPIRHGYNYFYFKTYEFDRDRSRFYEGEDHGRALQLCEIDVNGKTLQVGNVHGLYSKDKNDTDRTIMQSKFFMEKIKGKDFPTVLLGDFNVGPQTESIKILNDEYTNVNNIYSIISTRPGEGKEMIDFVFTSKELLTKSLVVDQTDLSDHYPLIVEVELD